MSAVMGLNVQTETLELQFIIGDLSVCNFSYLIPPWLIAFDAYIDSGGGLVLAWDTVIEKAVGNKVLQYFTLRIFYPVHLVSVHFDIVCEQ
ncbi:hypothetical protein EMIT0P100_30239 [Pseudomonas sp. IT-P100]